MVGRRGHLAHGGHVFGLVPLLEWLRPPGTPPSGTPAATDAKRHLFFDGLLYLNVPLQFALLAFYLYAMHTRGYSVAEAAGAVYYRMPAPEGREAARFVASWSTTPEDVQALLDALAP